MRKILIVDDEKIERNGIRFLIKTFNFPLEIAEAVNGQAALDYLALHPADILFTDVKMPFMDGLELSEKALKKYPNLKIIIFSGFDEFTYAKTAIRIGVSDYLLKPVDPDEFRTIVEKLLTALDEQDRQRDRMDRAKRFRQDHLLFRCVNGLSSERLIKEAGQAELLSFMDSFGRMLLIEYNTGFFENVPADFEEKLAEGTGLSFRYLNLNPQQSILFFDQKYRCDYSVAAEKLQAFLQKEYREPCFIAVSGSFSGYARIPEQLKEMERRMEYRFYQNDVTVFLPEMEKALDGGEGVDDEAVMRQLKEDIKIKNGEQLRNHVSMLCAVLKNKTGFSQIYIKFIFANILKEIYHSAAKLETKQLDTALAKLYRGYTIDQVAEVVFEGIRLIEKEWDESVRSSRGEIEAVKRFIYENYRKDLSVESLAEQVHLAPSYLSFVFKKETGCNLSKFIKAYRMEKAKDLLENTNEKIVTVCSLVGFSNVSYFCQSFREYYGISPEKFRRNGEGNEGIC